MKWVLSLLIVIFLASFALSQEVKYAKQGDLQYEVGVGAAVCNCPDGCACESGGQCTHMASCPVHGNVAAYRASDGKTYRVVNGHTQVYTKTCNQNSCTTSWQNIAVSNSACAPAGANAGYSGGIVRGFFARRAEARQARREARSGRSGGACASCGS